METVFISWIVLEQKKCSLDSGFSGVVLDVLDEHFLAVLVLEEDVIIEEELCVGYEM